MKKPVAILILILVGILIIALSTLFVGVAFLGMALMIPEGGEWAIYSILAFFLLLVSYPVHGLRGFFKEKYNVKAPVFLICFCLPSLIAAETANLMYKSVPSGDASDILYTVLILWLITAGVITAWLVIGTFVSSLRKRVMK